MDTFVRDALDDSRCGLGPLTPALSLEGRGRCVVAVLVIQIRRVVSGCEDNLEGLPSGRGRSLSKPRVHGGFPDRHKVLQKIGFKRNVPDPSVRTRGVNG